MSAEPVTISVEQSGNNDMPLGHVVIGGAVLGLATALIASLLAALLHRMARRASVGLRVAIAGLVPFVLVLGLLIYGQIAFEGFDLVKLASGLAGLPPRGHVMFAIMIAVGLASASLVSRWLKRRRPRKQPPPVDTFS